MAELSPKDNNTSIIPAKVANWEHPDPRLCELVARAASLGHPDYRIAEIIGTDVKVIKRHYSTELSRGKDFLSLKVQEAGIQKVAEGDTKMIQFYLKHLTDMNEYALAKKYEYKPEEDEDDKAADTEDFSAFTTEEIKTFYRLRQKAKRKPTEVIEGTAKRVP